MITGGQIRAARSMLRWRVEDLAKRSGVGVRTILRLEAVDDVPQANVSTLKKITKSLESEGIEFVGSPDDAPGIRIHPRDKQV